MSSLPGQDKEMRVQQLQPASSLGSKPKPGRQTYRECLKNHAANVGGNVTDGCGEFMPSGGDGTLEALQCAACSCHRNFHRKEPSVQPVKMAFEESSSEEQLNFNEVAPPPPQFVARKRFRTKFTAEQKGRMLELAEKVGWRIPREDDAEVQRFCAEVGVKRQVFKVWMHNNKTASSSSKKLPHEF
ncbi:zinc-finger homeodomain protein 5-like [Salvia hispanica]|uniref:zinc-finger homeodomain protein 5-like n=1 Tax=Salvia hispanica TaxID=49212 RepID=UPI002009166E|nr:zinc-finger homeodomain protein 5-like [Salvia hispanica]